MQSPTDQLKCAKVLQTQEKLVELDRQRNGRREARNPKTPRSPKQALVFLFLIRTVLNRDYSTPYSKPY